MIEFLPVRADLKSGLFENAQYLPFILELFFKNKRLLSDDYFPEEDAELLDFIVGEINAIYPWFLVGVLDGEVLGAAWITHWHYPHSCQLHACIDRKFWGKTSLSATEEILSYIQQKTGIIRVQMEIPEFNAVAVNFAKKSGFIEEGLIRCATLKKGKPLNHVLLGRILNN
ncbi:MAG: GNAT family protein [bacterium]